MAQKVSAESYEHFANTGFLGNPPTSGRRKQRGRKGRPKPPVVYNVHARRSVSPLTASLAKTELCKFFGTGVCRNALMGVECAFAHYEQEHATRPDLRKTHLCHAFQSNCCKLTASQCIFAHGIDDLKVSNSEETAVIKEHLRDVVARFEFPHENLAQQPTNEETWLGAEVASPKMDASASS